MKQYRHLDELHSGFNKKRIAIRRRLQEYREIPEDKYFYELLYCLMTPQSSAVNAAKAQRNFEVHNFQFTDIDPEPMLYQKDYYIRFHKSKAKWISEMKSNYPAIFAVTVNTLSAIEKREWFVKNVKGLSYKEATHFLRNIGKNEGLVILDRHILKNLFYYKIISSIPKTVTKKNYFGIEKKFQQFANKIAISVDELDLLFWSNEAGEILK
jgi:N-glycosylase/DNA lyase